ncbi:UPF0223 family protein [Phocicoccus pinnipedialis]|uniref:Uncharacterized protein n=1 Tax=Phocicoccus pinnipedialis TaxID=110845 RepID=A0A6V7RIZ9_9BACL|nr:UPF0223 family protein [Jeotgalicoccus pinnipedialis]MBP1938996.1 uncharacterized protein YktA (UPF0223 family) [Jeotgalicoccus pinnipedialis]CAD2077250.1 hypothetical protein JEOPIN946_01442 [Jeotgalicoccus pinnipedialis]
MEKSYSYPLDLDWNTEEMIKVVKFFQLVEEGYENGVKASDLSDAYKYFKEIVPSKAEEKTLFRAFKSVSNLESFLLVKQLNTSDPNDILKV